MALKQNDSNYKEFGWIPSSWLDVHQKAAQSHWMCGLFVASRIFHGATANVHICTWDEDALHTIALPTNAIFGFQVQRSPRRDGSASQLRKGHQLRFLGNKWPILRRERIHMLWPHGFTGVCPLMHDCCDRLNGGIVKEEGRVTWHVFGIQMPQPGEDGNGCKGIEPRIHNIILGLYSHRCSHHIIIFIQRRNLLSIGYNLWIDDMGHPFQHLLEIHRCTGPGKLDRANIKC